MRFQLDINFNKNTFILCMTEFFSSFSYFGVLSILMLFFLHNIQIPEWEAYVTLGNFLAISFIAALAGGVLGGKYLPFRLACLLGFIGYVIGYFLLMYSQKVSMNTIYMNMSYKNMILFYAGLAFVACGFGLFESNVRNLFGIHYRNAAIETRNSGFIVLHAFNVAGQFLGPILLVYLRIHSSEYMFFGAGVVSVIGTIFLLINYSSLKSLESFFDRTIGKNVVMGIVKLVGMVFIAFYLMIQSWVGFVMFILLLVIAAYFYFTLTSHEFDKKADARIRILALFLFCFGLLIVEVCFKQTFGVINLLTKTYVNRTIFGIHVSTALFISLEPLFVLLSFFGIIKIREFLARRGRNLSAGDSITFGLLMLSISFGCLVAGTNFAINSKISVVWLLLSYFFMGIGELFTFPIVTASVAHWSPDRWKGGMMGFMGFMIGISSYINAKIGEFITPTTSSPTIATYTHLFSWLTIFSSTSALFFFIFWRWWLKKHRQELYN